MLIKFRVGKTLQSTLKYFYNQKLLEGTYYQTEISKSCFGHDFSLNLNITNAYSCKTQNGQAPHRLYSPWNSPGQNTGVGSLSLLQRIFPTHGSNPGLPHCRWILYQLSHKGSPRTLEWVAYPFSRDLPEPRIKLGSPVLQAYSLPTELSGKPLKTGTIIYVWINVCCVNLKNELTLIILVSFNYLLDLNLTYLLS